MKTDISYLRKVARYFEYSELLAAPNIVLILKTAADEIEHLREYVENKDTLRRDEKDV